MGETPATGYECPGLESPVEILIDEHGVPHIYADSDRDVFFAQGFNAARDRLWQMDFWRRRGLGLLSEVFGKGFVAHDRAARLFLYRGDMDEEWESYGSRAQEIVAAFVAGVNEYVGLVEKNPSMLPVEFRAVGYSPARWSPEDVVRIRAHGLYANVKSEVRRAILIREHGLDADAFRKTLEPEREISTPEGLDLERILEDVLAVYELATAPIEFGEPGRTSRMEGSNNWVVSPSRTATGRPILANDPHRAVSVPSLRYAAHLVSPNMNVIGAGEPFLPGISIGHNENIAFGLTIFSIDHEDLYVYETNPENPDEYQYRGGWENMRTVRERIPVRDSSPVEATLEFTRHGPIVHHDSGTNTAFAVRAAWLGAGMAPYLGSLAYMNASSWDEFSAAMEKWGSPGENQIYADTNGNIGWHTGGRVPIRPNWDGLLPVPGDGRYEWDGSLDANDLPSEYNPGRGFFSSANEMNLPEDHPPKNIPSFEWYEPHRARRIEEFLEGNANSTISDSIALQTDCLSLPAQRMLAILSDLAPHDEPSAKALELLRGWDCRLSPDSPAATLFELWFGGELRRAVLDRVLSREARKRIITDDENGEARSILALLENPDTRLGNPPDTARDELILRSLGETFVRISGRFGEAHENWEWGRVHRAALSHPLSPLVGDEARKSLDLPSLARGGGRDTVGNTDYDRGSLRQKTGALWRMVVDVGEWDESVFMNSPGQSGDPDSRHYDDHYEKWARDDGAFPLLFSRERIQNAARRRILLAPANKGKKEI